MSNFTETGPQARVQLSFFKGPINPVSPERTEKAKNVDIQAFRGCYEHFRGAVFI